MASVTKRGSTWYYSVNNYVDGIRKLIKKGGFRTKKEAQVAAMEVESKLQKGLQTQTKDKSFANYFEEWVEIYKANKHKNTKARYTNSVNVFT
ncbi:Arm DNA-binding domain-containing protein [Ureibacillus sp. MALMAid1270]|uniref:Arm DNA-binding domain-containing protein n=1 Tax=Ureibacillus sp. MALMAid1270 TaxID=3411629 RepID=UPI003BA567F2